jgi:hypothetical protein
MSLAGFFSVLLDDLMRFSFLFANPKFRFSFFLFISQNVNCLEIYFAENAMLKLK